MDATLNLLNSITWEAAATPVGLSLLVAVLMVLLVKPVIDLVAQWTWRRTHGSEPVPEDWQLRGVVVNFVTFGLCVLGAVVRLSGTGAEAGDIFTLALVACALAVLEYEVVKNLFKTGGVDISRLFSGPTG